MTSLQSPQISVVMPYYNNGRTLVASVESFANQQETQALEIIVVDDGSVPSAQAALSGKTFAVPVRVLHSKGQGQSAATNVGILEARGHILMLTCADIIATPKLLALHLMAHQKNPKACVMGHIDYAPWVSMTPLMAYLSEPRVQFDFASMVNPDDVPGSKLYAPNVSVRREDLIGVGMFDSALTYGYQDCDLGMRLERQGTRFIYRMHARVLHDHPNTVEGFVRRQYLVNKLWPKMAERHPGHANLEYISACLDHYVPRLAMLPHLVGLAKAHNKGTLDSSLPRSPHHQNLFALFAMIGNLAMVAGIISNIEALQKVLEVRHRSWIKALPLFDPTSCFGAV